MNYATATIDATDTERVGTIDGELTVTVDLEGITTASELANKLWELFPLEQAEDGDEDDTDMMPGHVTLSNPQGFAVHLFVKNHHILTGAGDTYHVHDSFDDIAQAWNDETDDDRREAMGEYLDDMGADDLSDFDEAYQGQYISGAAFAEQLCEDIGTVPKDFPSWICINWERTWESALRHDYHITDSGHVFRNL